MSQTSSSARPPQTLWEAIGEIVEIRTQQEIAPNKSDVGLFHRLREQQAQALLVVYAEAGELIATGQAPQDMIERLQRRLNIPCDYNRLSDQTAA